MAEIKRAKEHHVRLILLAIVDVLVPKITNHAQLHVGANVALIYMASDLYSQLDNEKPTGRRNSHLLEEKVLSF